MITYDHMEMTKLGEQKVLAERGYAGQRLRSYGQRLRA